MHNNILKRELNTAGIKTEKISGSLCKKIGPTKTINFFTTVKNKVLK